MGYARVKYFADLHIHSRFSRATSPNLDLEHLHQWAQLKGITVVGTGDFTHPGWFDELSSKLEPAEEGLYRLRPDIAKGIDREVYPSCRREVRFVLSAEISNIYKRADRTRKVHNVIFAPNLETAASVSARLDRIGNITSDGRPILGLDSRDLFEIVLESSPLAYLIPAHIWTPWFSVLGSKSGFDSIEACYGDLADQIFAVETGLSSDPAMNWMVSGLDRYTLVSNSDAHSPSKLGREANLFNTDLSYTAMFEALRSTNRSGYLGTVEFYPEQGKYHFDGHRKCDLRLSPGETVEKDGNCPVCGRKVTVGVMHRVSELADRPEGAEPPGARPFRSLIGLGDILAEIRGVGPGSKRVARDWEKLLAALGDEFTILQEVPIEDLERAGSPLLSEGVRRMRTGAITIDAGYDGEFGTVRIFEEGEREKLSGQIDLLPPAKKKKKAATPREKRGKKEGRRGAVPPKPGTGTERRDDGPAGNRPEGPIENLLNPMQREAVETSDGPLLIVAGPGTGKTLTLTCRIARIIRSGRARPENVLAVTFTNRAAREMRERLARILPEPGLSEGLTIETFHALGLKILRESIGLAGRCPDFTILDDEARDELLRTLFSDLDGRKRRVIGEQISAAKRELQDQDASKTIEADPRFATFYLIYENHLEHAGAVDFDDLIALPVLILRKHPGTLAQYRKRFRSISVDEVQDINRAQYELVRLLAADGSGLCAIGDPDQSIYAFRGADPGYFRKFESDYTQARVISLDRNYRSAETILNASSQVIVRNPGGRKEALRSGIEGVARIQIHRATTDRAEAEFVVHQIERLVGGTSHFSLDSGRADGEVEPEEWSFSDFAVLYRLGAQEAVLREAFDRSGIPFQLVRENPFRDEPGFRTILAVLKGVARPDCREAAAKIAGELGLGTDAMAGAIASGARIRNRGLPEFIRDLPERLAPPGCPDRPHWQWAADRLAGMAEEAGGSISDLLRRVTLTSGIDVYDERADRVALMTLHSSKGLEFGAVFIVGCEEGLIPYIRDSEEPSDGSLAEERRLFYVGMTRAGKRLFLVSAKSRFLFGERRARPVSRFVLDIEETLREELKSAHKGRRKETDLQLDLF